MREEACGVILEIGETGNTKQSRSLSAGRKESKVKRAGGDADGAKCEASDRDRLYLGFICSAGAFSPASCRCG